MADKDIKTDNEYLKDIAKKVGNTIVGTHSDNYYLRRIADKIGSGGGGEAYDDSDLKEKMGYDNIPSGENLQGQITELQEAVEDLDEGFDDKADKTNGASQITDGNADDYTNIGILLSGATQQEINDAINTKLGVIEGLEFIIITTNKGTASADTMNKLYIEVGGTTELYYTVKEGNVYSWEKLSDDLLDNLSIGWSDIQNKPSTFAPSSHTHTESQISDLGDYIEKSNTNGLVKNDGTIDTTSYVSDISGKSDVGHTHTESEITDLKNYIETSSTGGLVKNDGSIDTNTYSQTGHSHIESDISDLGDYIAKSNTSGLVKNDGTIDTNTYSQSGHTHVMDDVTDLSLPEAIKIVTDKGTASADTMDRIYIEVSGNSADVYYTTKSGNTYSWHKMDTDILDDLSIDWSDVQNKPSIPEDVSDLTDTTGIIPTDVSDLTDTDDTAFTPKSHSHSISDLPTANSITDGDTTHIASVDVIYDYIDSIIGDADDWLTS